MEHFFIKLPLPKSTTVLAAVADADADWAQFEVSISRV